MFLVFLLCFLYVIKSHEFWFDEMRGITNGNNINWMYNDINDHGFRQQTNEFCDQYNVRNTDIACVQIKGGGILTHITSTNTSGYYNITLSCLINHNPVHNLESNEHFIIEYSINNDLENWYFLAEFDQYSIPNNGSSIQEYTIIQLPNVASNNIGVSVRFRNSGDGRNDRTYLDSVSLSGTLIQMYISESTEPSMNPSNYPSMMPTLEPTEYPTTNPSINPSADPSIQPSSNANMFPTSDPTLPPTTNPTTNPSTNPSKNPTVRPSILTNINQPTGEPTKYPTITPTLSPSYYVTTDYPSLLPTQLPTGIETDDGTNGLQDKNTALKITIGIISGIVIILIAIIVYQRVKEHLHLKELKLKEIASLSTMKNSNNSNQRETSDELEGTMTMEGCVQPKRNTISPRESNISDVKSVEIEMDGLAIDGMTPNDRQFKYEINSLSKVSYYMNQNG